MATWKIVATIVCSGACALIGAIQPNGGAINASIGGKFMISGGSYGSCCAETRRCRMTRRREEGIASDPWCEKLCSTESWECTCALSFDSSSVNLRAGLQLVLSRRLPDAKESTRRTKDIFFYKELHGRVCARYHDFDIRA